MASKINQWANAALNGGQGIEAISKVAEAIFGAKQGNREGLLAQGIYLKAGNNRHISKLNDKQTVLQPAKRKLEAVHCAARDGKRAVGVYVKYHNGAVPPVIATEISHRQWTSIK